MMIQNQDSKHLQVVSLRMHKETDLLLTQEEVNNQYVAGKIFQKLLSKRDREIFAVLCMDTKGKPTCYSEVHVGTLSQTLIHPREVFKVAILSNAQSIIVAHNHPSGNDSPSQQDLDISKTLIKAGKLLGIAVLDHLIVTEDTVLSLRTIYQNIFK